MPTRHQCNSKITLDRSRNPAEVEAERYGRYNTSAGVASVPKPPEDHGGRHPNGGRRRRTSSRNARGQSSRTEKQAKQGSRHGEVPPEPAPRYLVTPSAETDRAYSSAGMTPLHSPRPETGRQTSKGRSRSKSGAAKDDEEGPVLHEEEQPTYVVGNAILNPYVPVAASVQQLVQIVPTLLHLPDAALRQPLGGSLQVPPSLPSTSRKQPYPPTSAPPSAASPRVEAIMADGGEGVAAPTEGADSSLTMPAAQQQQPRGAPQGSSQIRRLFPVDDEMVDSNADDDEEEELEIARRQQSRPARSSKVVVVDHDGSTSTVSASQQNVTLQQVNRRPSHVATDEIVPGLDGVVIAPGTELLCIEEVFGQNGPLSTVTAESTSPADVVEMPDGTIVPPEIRPSVLGLQKLYGTTTNDIAIAHGVRGSAPGFVASEVLPVLRRAEQRVQELAAARRLVDWDITIPTAETIPPPAIAFLDENGAAVHNFPTVVFTLDSTSLRLCREENTQQQQLNSTATTSAPAATRKVNANAQSVGKHVTYEDGVHRIHGLVGLMIGLAEKVGLDRVMEYDVQTTSHELFVAAPYVDSDSGDLVLQMNSTIQGTIKLVIVGHDCGSVDVDKLEVQKSVNHLECIVKVQYAHDAPNRPPPTGAADTPQQQQQVNPTSGGVVREDEDGNSSFVFAATNPHELRYEECRQATREFLANKTMLEERDKQSMGGSGSGVLLSSGAKGADSHSASKTESMSTSFSPHTSSNQPHPVIADPADQKMDAAQRLPDSIGPCEPMTTSIGFHLGSFHHLLFYFRYAAWQNTLNDLLCVQFGMSPEDLPPESRGRATADLFKGPDAFSRRQEFIASAKSVLGPAVTENLNISEEPIVLHQRPGTGQVITNERNTLLLRDLILVLALETNRPRRYHFHELITLCHRLYHSALIKTTTSTKGTSEGLEQIAQWAITPEAERPSVCWRHPLFPDGQLKMNEKERKFFECLADALNVATRVSAHIGAFAEAIFYATQRVYTLCILRDGADTEVCGAQRDLAELYMFYGDYAAAQQIAVDVVALCEKLYDVDAPELIESQILSSIAHLSSNNIEVGVSQLNELFSQVVRRSPHVPPVLSCIIQLFVVYAQSTCSLFREYFPKLQLDNPVPYIDGVIRVIAGEEFLPADEKHQFPSANPSRKSSRNASKQKAKLGDFLHSPVASGYIPSEKLFSRYNRQVVSPDGEEVDDVDSTGAVRMQSCLLALAGVLLIRCGAHSRGVKLLYQSIDKLRDASMPDTEGKDSVSTEDHKPANAEVPDGAEGIVASGNTKKETAAEGVDAEPQNDNDPFGHCQRITVLAQAHAAVWKMWSRPSSLQESTESLRKSSVKLQQLWGPIHPYTAMIQLILAQALQNSPHSHALSFANRSLALLRRCVSSRCWYFLLAHRTLSRLHTLVHHWKEALEHTNAALVLAQLNYCTDDVMCQVEEDFLGCLLRCPPGTVVRLDYVRLLKRLQERIAHLESIHGVHSELLVWPLVNLAEAYYMLRDMNAALSCLQRAVRLADPKGSLFVTTSTLKPASLLPSKSEVQRRDLMITSVLQTRDRILQLSQVLFTMAAVLEAMGTISDAQDCYSRCLALLESAGVESSLSAIRVYTAVAKLLYSSHEYGDSLGWARKADRLTHSHYPEWAQESQITRSLLSIVEHRLYTEEGTFVTVNPHNHFDDFVELI